MNSDSADYLATLAETQGAACATVKDGHILVFKRDFLQRLVEKSSQETFVIFVKRGDLQ